MTKARWNKATPDTATPIEGTEQRLIVRRPFRIKHLSNIGGTFAHRISEAEYTARSNAHHAMFKMVFCLLVLQRVVQAVTGNDTNLYLHDSTNALDVRLGFNSWEFPQILSDVDTYCPALSIERYPVGSFGHQFDEHCDVGSASISVDTQNGVAISHAMSACLDIIMSHCPADSSSSLSLSPLAIGLICAAVILICIGGVACQRSRSGSAISDYHVHHDDIEAHGHQITHSTGHHDVEMHHQVEHHATGGGHHRDYR
jgi:hypothetical protein